MTKPKPAKKVKTLVVTVVRYGMQVTVTQYSVGFDRWFQVSTENLLLKRDKKGNKSHPDNFYSVSISGDESRKQLGEAVAELLTRLLLLNNNKILVPNVDYCLSYRDLHHSMLNAGMYLIEAYRSSDKSSDSQETIACFLADYSLFYAESSQQMCATVIDHLVTLRNDTSATGAETFRVDPDFTAETFVESAATADKG
jgi:hypothetical protein